MNILLNFIQSFFGSAGLVVGLFALFGSILLRRTFMQTIVSTFTTILGFFILSLGGGAIGTAMTDFKNMFGIIVGSGSGGTVAGSDAFAIAMMNNTANIAAVTSIMLLLAILFNLLLAGTTRFKNIYLSTHIVMYFCVGFTAMYMLCAPNGVSDIALDKQGLIIAVIGAALIAVYTTLAPSLTTKVTYDLMKDKSLNLCHHGLFCFSLAQGVGKLCGKMQKGKYTSTENMHLPRWMQFLKNSNVTIILVMTLLFTIVFVTAYIKDSSAAENWIKDSPTGLKSLGVVLVVDAFMFTAGLLVLIEGITMMVNELRECIKGISQRFIVGAKMSVDASLVLKTQPIAVLLGFLASFIGATVTMGISFVFHAMDSALFSTIILPSVTIFFFLGGIAGIFGNMRGGLLGCLLAGFVVGLVVSLLPIILIVTWNTLSPAPTGGAWYNNNQYWQWTGGTVPTAISANSYGESDYILIPIFGWIMYGTKSIGSIGGGINSGTFIMIAMIVVLWSVLIVDGQLKVRRDKNINPQIFYNHKLHNIQDASKHYSEIYQSKIAYINQSLKSLNQKKNAYGLIKYQRKLSRLDTLKHKTNAKFNKQKHKIKSRLLQLKTQR